MFSSCASKRHLIKTNTTITRTADTLISIPSRTIEFIPQTNLQNIDLTKNDLPIISKSVEVLSDSITGQQMTIYYKEVMPIQNMPIKTIEKIKFHVPERKVAVKIHETVQTSTKEKTAIGIPWYYKASLFLVLGSFLFFILKKYLKIFPL